MKQEGRDKIISVILLFLWCCLIFYFSNQVGSVSENSSSNVILILNNILKVFSFKIDITNSILVTIIIRKLAHMFLYFTLYIFCFYVSHSYKINKKIFFCFFFCFLYAISDEIHQLFIFERSFGIQDILIDLSGATIAFFFLKLQKILNTKINKEL